MDLADVSVNSEENVEEMGKSTSGESFIPRTASLQSRFVNRGLLIFSYCDECTGNSNESGTNYELRGFGL